MTFLLIILSILFPRLSLFLIAITTNWFTTAYQTTIWPFLGFIFLPYTTVAYLTVQLNGGGFWWFPLYVLALLADLTSGQYKVHKAVEERE